MIPVAIVAMFLGLAAGGYSIARGLRAAGELIASGLFALAEALRRNP